MFRFPRSALPLLCLLILTACGEEDTDVSQNGAAHWQLSPQYVSATMMKSDANIGELLRYGQWTQLTPRDIGANAYARYRRMAAKMKLHPAPALYLDTEDRQALPQAQARFTQAMRGYILINPQAREAWSPRELVAVLGHELVHLKERHVTAQNLALAYNHPELSVAHELEADRVGSGPLGSCDPQGLEAALQKVFEKDQGDYLTRNPGKTPDDYIGLEDGDHPHWPERKAALDGMAAHPPAGCR